MKYRVERNPDGEWIMADVWKRGAGLLTDALFNKGTAFTQEERQLFDLDGMLPHQVTDRKHQVNRAWEHLQAKGDDPLEKVEASKIYEVAEALPDNGLLRVHVMGETLEGDMVDKVVMLPVGEPGPGKDRIEMVAGLELREEGGKMLVDNIVFGGPAEKQKIDFDWEVVDVQQKADTPDKRWFYIPAILLLIVVWRTQSARRDQDKLTPVEA